MSKADRVGAIVSKELTPGLAIDPAPQGERIAAPAGFVFWTPGLINRLVKAVDGLVLGLAGLLSWMAALDRG
ncbi:hypothetical protein ABTF87_19175, partial [Acinetobacter baumannii]